MLKATRRYFIKRINIAKISFQEILAFRIDIASILVSTFIIILLGYSLWSSIYKSNSDLNGYSSNSIINYILIATLLNSVLNTPRRVPINISREIRTGQIATKLIKPVSYYEFNFWHCFGRGLYFFIIVTIPLMIISYILFGLKLPSSFFTGVIFILSTLMGFVIEIGLSLLLAGFVFKTINMDGVLKVNAFFSYLFSGRLIPLEFFPKYLRLIANYLPYRGTVSIPINIYLGKSNIKEDLIIQLFWVILLLLLSNILFKNAYKRMEVMGG
jgi:ABC-2 type transport system permease protein